MTAVHIQIEFDRVLNIAIKLRYMVLYAQDIMQKAHSTLSASVKASNAAKIMANDHQGFIVVDINGVPAGMVTEWDFISKIISKGINPDDVTLGDIMQSELFSVEPTTPTEKVVTLMNERGIRRIPVMKNGRLLGVITSKDILRIFRDYMDNLTEVISRFGDI